MSDFTVGELIEARVVQSASGATEHYEAPRRFIVHAVSASGWLYAHPFGHRRERWNEYHVHEREARRPAPGELVEEFGR